MRVPLLDLQAGYASQKEEIQAAVMEVLETQRFIDGPRVAELEAAVAAYVGSRFGIGCASGSDALLLALMALGVGEGDEVVTSPYTFFATAGAVSRLGARPVFVDVDARTLNAEPAALEAAITPRTRAIIPVHLFGQCVDLEALADLQRRRGIPVVEDAAQAIGARWGALRAGSVGRVGCFSFYPSKNLGGYGDGGLVTTDDPALDERLRSLRSHGNHPRKYHHRWVGLNSRLDALQAAVLGVKLRRLEAWHEARRVNAARYRALFAERDLEDVVILPFEDPRGRHVYNQFCIRAERRDALLEHLKGAGVGAEVYYPVPLHLQRCFADLGYAPGDFPVAEAAAARALAIPIYPELSAEAQGYVVDQIARFYGRG